MADLISAGLAFGRSPKYSAARPAICGDDIDADCDGIDPACATPSWDELLPLIDDPGFEWNTNGDPVYTRPATVTLHGTGCSASVGDRGNAMWIFGLALSALAMRRKR